MIDASLPYPGESAEHHFDRLWQRRMTRMKAVNRTLAEMIESNPITPMMWREDYRRRFPAQWRELEALETGEY